MKKLLFLFLFTLGTITSVNAQTKFVVDLEGQKTELDVSGTYKPEEVEVTLKTNSYNGVNARYVPVYVYTWDGSGLHYDGMYQFGIYPWDTMDTIIDRLIKMFF
ncbi:hypothetical protein AMR72_15640 [Flavobacterium psychrophilum]|nr:hypothetical protein AMR72_15640 [Flavobacterium psychrophilum]AOE53817.1 hypothetical protein ALW18_15630 [Flavobacterium psychrophilum]